MKNGKNKNKISYYIINIVYLGGLWPQIRGWFNVMCHVWGFFIILFMVVQNDRCRCQCDSAWQLSWHIILMI
jgi:NADH:ubiquinone oxidoreductase subunit H